MKEFLFDFVVPFISVTISFQISRLIEKKSWQRELIRRNLALYDPITGKWRWREDLDEEKKI